MALRKRVYLIDDTSREQGEVSGVHRNVDLGQTAHQSIEEEVRGPQGQRLLPLHPRRVDDVISALVLGYEPWNLFGPVLEVSVHHDDDVPSDRL